MNNNEEITPNKEQEQKIDTPENNVEEPILENNLEKKIEELNDKLLRSLAENQNLRKIHEKEREDFDFQLANEVIYHLILQFFFQDYFLN